MMAEKHGISLELQENISAALGSAADAGVRARSKIGRAASAIGASFDATTDKVVETTKAVTGLGSGAVGGFSALSRAILVFDSVLAISSRTLDTWDATVGSAIDTALRFRKENDAAVKTFKRLDRETELLKARIGDALIPVVLGLNEAFFETGDAIHKTVAENQRLIGGTLLDWIQKVGKGLIQAIAIPVHAVAKAWLGWQAVIGLVEVAVLKFVSKFRLMIAELLKGVEELARFAGFDSIADQIVNLRKEAETGVKLEESLGRAEAALQDTADEIQSVEAQIEGLKNTALETFDRGMTKAQERVQKAVKGTTKTIEEQREAISKLSAQIDRVVSQRQESRDRRLGFELEAAQSTDAAQQRALDKQRAALEAAAKESTQAQAEVRQQVADAATSAMGDVGSVIQGAMAGGPIGALIAAGSAIAMRSESFQKTMSMLGDMFGKLADVLEPWFRPLETATAAISAISDSIAGLLTVLTAIDPALKSMEIVTAMLVPLIEALGMVLEKISLGLLDIFDKFRGTWNQVVRAIAGVLKDLGDIKIFGKKPLGALKDWGEDLERAAVVSSEALDRMRDEITGAADAAGGASRLLRQSSEDIAEATSEVAGSMTNVPEGLKLALNRFRATDPDNPGMAGAGAPGGTGSKTGTTFNVGQILIENGGNIDQLMDEVQKEAERTGVEAAGIISGTDAQDWLPLVPSYRALRNTLNRWPMGAGA